jgi:K+-transporting ATPase A subunit
MNPVTTRFIGLGLCLLAVYLVILNFTDDLGIGRLPQFLSALGAGIEYKARNAGQR